MLTRRSRSSDDDCSLNGVCSPDGECACDAGWSGRSCSALRLLPVPSGSGLNESAGGKRVSSWGGTVHRLEDGRFGMLASQLVNHCGLNAWTRNSRVIFATSATAVGPYRQQSVIEGTFSHEPSVARAPNGSWVMYFTRPFDEVGWPAPCNCSDGSTPDACGGEVGARQHATFMATAPTLAGPWSPPRLVPLLDCNRSFCQHDMNLAGTIRPDGTFVGMVKVNSPSRGSEAHLVTASDWADASGYRQSSNGENGNLFNASSHPPDGGRVEDPSEPWVDGRGNWHVLFHAESPTGAPWARSGGHAFSRDGRRWTYTGTAFDTTVVRSADGTRQLYRRHGSGPTWCSQTPRGRRCRRT